MELPVNDDGLNLLHLTILCVLREFGPTLASKLCELVYRTGGEEVQSYLDQDEDGLFRRACLEVEFMRYAQVNSGGWWFLTPKGKELTKTDEEGDLARTPIPVH